MSLREEARTRRASLSQKERKSSSATIHQHLSLTFPQRDDILLIYHSTQDEVDTRSIFAQNNAHTFAPVVGSSQQMTWHQASRETTWKSGRFGIEEPQSERCWQPREDKRTILICPLLAFDRNGNRLGMGMGYFDRWLAQFSMHLECMIGLAFSCQEFEQLPTEPHDIPLDFIITEHEVIRCLKT
ncbi:MAG: 5-formyltetrahydrofolate cyclo-ligase [Mariprofundaceae bacterium]